MAKYALEQEMVFDPTVIGFPSLKGCHGIVYVTDAGLFGYHNYGGEYAERYHPRFDLFKDWLAVHPSGRSPGRAIYGACYLTAPPGDANTVRAYSDPKMDNWIAELKAFAHAASNFTGPIHGYDLGKSEHTGSSYVEFTRVGATCVVQVRQWVDGQPETTKAPCIDNTNLQYIRARGYDVSRVDQTNEIVTGVATAGLRTVYPARLH